MNDIENVYLECDCNSSEHMIKLIYFPEEKFEDKELYLVHFIHHKSLIDRIKFAIKYIFCANTEKQFQEHLFNRQSALKFKSILEKYLDS